LLVKGVNVFPNAVRDVVNRYGDTTTGNIRLLLPQAGPVIEPPVVVLVETPLGIDEAQQQKMCQELETAIHHQIRFRAKVVLQPMGQFEVQTGATGKSKLLEINVESHRLALEGKL
jgi:phenylacetate-CoA ligase